MEVAEGLLLGNDGDVVGLGVGDELAGLLGRDAALEGSGDGVRDVGLSVLEVWRVDVDLIGGDDADLLLLEVEGGEGAAGEVVVEAAILHGGPVVDVGSVEDGFGAVAGDELLDGLGSVEDAFGGGSGDDDGGGGGGDDVAFGLHLVGEAGDGMVGEAKEFDVEAAGGDDVDAAILEGFGEVIDGELVVGRAGAGAGDADAVGEGDVGGGLDLAGHGDELEGLVRGLGLKGS